MAVHLWFGRIILRTPRVPRAGPVRASYGPRTGIFHVFLSYGARAGPSRVPYGSLTDTYGNSHKQNWQNARTGVVFGRTAPARAPHGLFPGCSRTQNPYGARKLIMHALKLYGPRTGRQNSYGAARGPYGPREWTYDLCWKQPGNSPGTACTGPGGVMWLRHYPGASRLPGSLATGTSTGTSYSSAFPHSSPIQTPCGTP